MTIRATTRLTAPIQLNEPVNTTGLSLIESDFGRAFLAVASDDQRRRILAMLLRSNRPLDREAHDIAAVDAMLQNVRTCGYAVRGRHYDVARSSTIAVGIVVNGEAVGSLNVICRRRAIPATDIPLLFLKELRQTAAEIAKEITRT